MINYINFQNNLKVCFMGGRQAGIVSVLSILSKGCKILSAVSYTDDLTNILNLFGVPICKSINDGDFIKKLSESDIFLSVHGREIVKVDLLKLPRYGSINVHPYYYKYKGPNPVGRALKDNNLKASLGAHFMTSQIDRGKTIIKEFVDVTGANSVEEVYNKLYGHYCNVVLKIINKMSEINFVNILEVDNDLKQKVREWRNRDDIRKRCLNQDIITKEEHCKWLENLKYSNNWKVWLVFADNTPIGSVSLKNIDYEKLTSEWGCYIAEDAYIGKGLGKIILFKLMVLFFDEMRLKFLFTKALSDNIMALELYKKFKFKEINRAPFKNKIELILFEFSKEDWLKLKEELRDECYCNNKK